MEKQEIKKILLGRNYPTPEALRYDVKKGFLLSKSDLASFLQAKEELRASGSSGFVTLGLKAEHPLFYVSGRYLLELEKTYLETLLNDYAENDTDFFDRNKEDMLLARAFSEIEGTLAIENVSTTRKKIERIRKQTNLTDKNDVIVKNMLGAIDYILQEKPAFTKENLKRLYSILSDGCLEGENALPVGAYYRNAPVFVGGYEGAAPEEIEGMMNSLFAFVSERKAGDVPDLFVPLIAQYYILFVHPYFDYNGRTARMVSFWLSVLYSVSGAPLFLSEAINEDKKNYYRAIVNTRNTDNDLTYFLGYILETAVRYSYVYKNVEMIRRALGEEGLFLSPMQVVYLKKIVIHNYGGYFNAKMFAGYMQSDLSRQAVAKILTQFVSYGILEKTANKKGETIFRIKQQMIFYRVGD